jgi:hypothetical protein
MTYLHGLRISFTVPPGSLTDVRALGVHWNLHTLEIESAYDWNPRELPDLPALRHVAPDGTRQTTVEAANALYKGTDADLSIRGA